MAKRPRSIRTARNVLTVVGATGVVTVTDAHIGGLILSVAAIGCAGWLCVLFTVAWTHLSAAGAALYEVDAAAVEHVHDTQTVIDGIQAMAAWRQANRARRPLLLRLANRAHQPIRGSGHEAARITRLRN